MAKKINNGESTSKFTKRTVTSGTKRVAKSKHIKPTASPKPVEPYLIKGCVVELKTREGLAGLLVEAWDKDLIFNDLVGSAK